MLTVGEFTGGVLGGVKQDLAPQLKVPSRRYQHVASASEEICGQVGDRAGVLVA